MLKKLRHKKTAKKIWIVLAILILPAFVFWGFGSFLTNKQKVGYAGKIGGKKVSLLEYKDAIDAVKNQAIIQFGDNFPQIEKRINFGALAWDRLLLLAEAKKRKVTASDKEVIEAIESYPFFQKKGVFNTQIYNSMLQYVFRTQPRIFEEQIRQSITLSKLYEALTRNINLSEEEIKKEYQRLNEQLNLDYIAALPLDLAKGISVSEEEIKNYFTKNSFRFKQPPSFNLEYICVPSLDKNEEADANKIKTIVSRLNKKEDFTKVAKEFGFTVKETGFFAQTDPIPGIGWSSPEIFSIISKLKTGEFTPAIYIDKNYYILRLKEKKEAYVPDFQAIKEKVKEVFVGEEAEKAAKQKIEECLAELNAAYKDSPKPIDFNRLAKKYSLKTGSTGLFKYGSYIEGIGASDNFFTAGLDLKEGAFSGIIRVPSGFYIIKLKSRIPVDEKKFSEEKSEFARKMLLQKKEEFFSGLLEDLKRKSQLLYGY